MNFQAGAIATIVAAAVWWIGFRLIPARCLSSKHYVPCAGGWNEALLDGCQGGIPHGLPEQPWNTWSNLAYVYVGWLAGPWQFTVLMTLLGTSSALYHGTSTRWAGRMDVTALYSTVLGTAMLAANKHPVFLVLAILMGWVFGRLERKDLTLPVGVGFAWSVIVASVAQNRVPVVAGIFFAAAYCFWLADKRGWTGRWGHAVWHVLTAPGLRALLA